MVAIKMATYGLFAIALALTPTQRWNAASSFFAGSSPEGFFTILAIISLITAVALLFWVFARSKRSQHGLELKVRELAVKNVRLRQENIELTAANEKLQQESAELRQKQVEILENIINGETPSQEEPALVTDETNSAETELEQP